MEHFPADYSPEERLPREKIIKVLWQKTFSFRCSIVPFPQKENMAVASVLIW